MVTTLTALVLSTFVHAAEPKARQDIAGANSGKIVQLTGHARNLTKSEELKVGSKVTFGDRIKTDADALVRATLGNDVAIQIGPSSEVVLEESASSASGWSANLIEGKLLSAVRKAASLLIGPNKTAKFEVRAANSTMGVRGTVTFVARKAGVPTFVCVCMGTADLKTGPRVTARTFVNKHHENAQYFDDQGRPAEEKVDPEYMKHSDDDMKALAKLANS